MKQHLFNKENNGKIVVVAALLLLLSACGGGGSSSDGSDDVLSELDSTQPATPTDTTADIPLDTIPNTPIDANTGEPTPEIDLTTELEIDTQGEELLENSGFEAVGTDGDTPLAEDNGDLLPRVFPTTTSLDLAYAMAGAVLIEQLNESLALPADIDVNFTDCGTANAFFATAPDDGLESSFISSGGAIFMCHELVELFGQFFGNSDQAFAASIFVLLHELGHALVDQLTLPVLGIEESYVDGMASVLVGESGLAEGAVFAGWFFGAQGATPFFDSHRANAQRLGDLACWGTGADPGLLDDELINTIKDSLVLGGRDCPAEYEQQRRALEFVLGPNIRGGLQNTFNPEDLPIGESAF